MRAPLWVLLGAVGLVLLIAYANVASLMLARAADREREVATRIAMGASRLRLFRQFLTESLLLAALGSSMGLVLALWGVDFLLSLVPQSVPRFAEVTVDGHALGFTLVVAVLTGLAFGLVPAVSASKPNLHRCLKEGGRGSSGGSQRFRSALVIFEVAMALALLVGAGLLIRSFASLMQVDPGFDTSGVLTAQLNLVGPAYDQRPARASFVDRLIDRVEALPGVEGVGVIFVLPMANANADAGFLIEGREPPRPGQTPVAWYRPVSPGYFETMKMRHTRGRLFRDGDAAEAPQVVLINEAAATRYWANEDPLLSAVRFGGASRRVVGVVFDTKHFGLDRAPRHVRSDALHELVGAHEREPGRPSARGRSRARGRECHHHGRRTRRGEPRVVTTLLVFFALSALAFGLQRGKTSTRNISALIKPRASRFEVVRERSE